METHEQTAKSRRMRDLALVAGILTACSAHIETVELFIKELPPEAAKDMRQAAVLIIRARDSAAREFSRLESMPPVPIENVTKRILDEAKRGF